MCIRDSTTTVVDDLRSVLVPTTSEILWGVIDGSLLSTVWNLSLIHI